jgi:hypothetical protein
MSLPVPWRHAITASRRNDRALGYNGRMELGPAAKAAWDAAVERCLPRHHPYLLRAPDRRTPYPVAPDWTALPLRVTGCLGRERALVRLDAERGLQEEYAEWRTVRDAGGKVVRVELTTELRDYWRVLIEHEPARASELAGEFTGRGDLHDLGRLNRDGICFMTHPNNDLAALAKLAAAAAMPCTADGRRATAREVIPLLGDAAVAGRASDPAIVEALGRLASERRLVALADPLGVRIAGVQHARLRTPGGEPVPREWFAVARADRRMVFEVPAGEGFSVGDLVDAATERPVRYGAQIAELVQLRVLFRASAPNAARSRARLEADPRRRAPVRCGDVR